MLDVRVPDASVSFECINHSRSRVTVAISLHDYEDVVLETLESVRLQDIGSVDLVVVDDASRDGGLSIVRDWMAKHRARFGRSVLVQHSSNEGLAAARNQGFATAATPYVFVLDADNLLYPRCLTSCLAVAEASKADAVYPLLEVFGEATGLMGTDEWEPDALLRKNYIDAMTLVRSRAWADVGGYRRMPAPGWEDYDFWLKFAETGMKVVRVPQILCRYRVRASSMLRRTANKAEMLEVLHADMRLHHPAVVLEGAPRPEPGTP